METAHLFRYLAPPSVYSENTKGQDQEIHEQHNFHRLYKDNCNIDCLTVSISGMVVSLRLIYEWVEAHSRGGTTNKKMSVTWSGCGQSTQSSVKSVSTLASGQAQHQNSFKAGQWDGKHVIGFKLCLEPVAFRCVPSPRQVWSLLPLIQVSWTLWPPEKYE